MMQYLEYKSGGKYPLNRSVPKDTLDGMQDAGVIIPGGYVVLDFDNTSFESISKYLDFFGILTQIVKTDRGVHVWFLRGQHAPTKQDRGMTVFGVPAEVKLPGQNKNGIANSITIKRNGVERTHVNRGIFAPYPEILQHVGSKWKTVYDKYGGERDNFLFATVTEKRSGGFVALSSLALKKQVLQFMQNHYFPDPLEGGIEKFYLKLEGKRPKKTSTPLLSDRQYFRRYSDILYAYDPDNQIYSPKHRNFENQVVNLCGFTSNQQFRDDCTRASLYAPTEKTAPAIRIGNGTIVDGSYTTRNVDWVTQHLPWRYDPETLKTESLLDKFLMKTFGDKEVVNELYHAIAGMLITDPAVKGSINYLYGFIGHGRNGKSTLLSVLRKFITSEASHSMDLSLFNRAENIVTLEGKLANLADDLPDRTLASGAVANIKTIITCDALTVRKLYEQNSSTNITSTIIFSKNGLLSSSDKSFGFGRRVRYFEFENIIPDDQLDPFLYDKLTTEQEMDALMTRVIDRLPNLQNRKYPKSKKVTKFTDKALSLDNRVKTYLEVFSVDDFKDRPCKEVIDEVNAYLTESGLENVKYRAVDAEMYYMFGLERTIGRKNSKPCDHYTPRIPWTPQTPEPAEAPPEPITPVQPEAVPAPEEGVIILDVEVYSEHDTYLAGIDTNGETLFKIWNPQDDPTTLQKHLRGKIIVGFNNYHYDDHIIDSMIRGNSGADIYNLSKSIIHNKDYDPGKPSKLHALIQNSLDVKQDLPPNMSLKAIAGNRLHNIKHSEIGFDLERPLTAPERSQEENYQLNDTLETLVIYKDRKEYFSNKRRLLEIGGLSERNLRNSASSLATKSIVPNGKVGRWYYLKDFDGILDTPQHLVNKYNIPPEVADMFFEYGEASREMALDPTKKPGKYNYTQRYGDIDLEWSAGGMHGASYSLQMHHGLVGLDVASLYPALAIRLNALGNFTNQYEQVMSERLVLKARKDVESQSKQSALKLAINSVYGNLKNQYSPVFNPLAGSSICVMGQIVLYDLVRRLRGVTLVNVNTDGVMFKPNGTDYKTAWRDWETAWGLVLEETIFDKFYQKDVNNYLAIIDGKLIGKGNIASGLKQNPILKLHDFDIKRLATAHYLMHDKPLEDIIATNKSNLTLFQAIKKPVVNCSAFVIDDTQYHGHQRLLLTPDSKPIYQLRRDDNELIKVAGVTNATIASGCPKGYKLDDEQYLQLSKEYLRLWQDGG